MHDSDATPDPERDPELEHAEADEGGLPARSPYKNLWAPLVVVPALIVMVLALVGLLFGAIAGKPSSVADYVDAIVTGGRNERKQALFGLTRRIAENESALLRGESEEWERDRAALEPLLEDAWQNTRAEDLEIRYVLASLMAQLDMQEGVPRLAELLLLTEAEDPEAKLRFDVVASLGSFGDERALPALERAAHDPDKGLRSIAVVALQKLPLEKVRPTLVAALGDEAFEVRVNAAIALSVLGDPAGAAVLRDAVDPEVYAAERALDARLFAGEATVSESRIAAVGALAHLRRSEDRELVERVAAGDDDLNVRGAAKRALATWNERAEAGN